MGVQYPYKLATTYEGIKLARSSNANHTPDTFGETRIFSFDQNEIFHMYFRGKCGDIPGTILLPYFSSIFPTNILYVYSNRLQYFHGVISKVYEQVMIELIVLEPFR